MTSRRLIIGFILALALVRGIIYGSVVPPWQAPDEPPQFERAKAALNAADWASTSENGPAWYDDLIQSLFTFGYWDFLDTDRQTYSPDAPLNQFIAPYNEIYEGLYGSRPTYILVGWPLLLTQPPVLVLQLYLVRLGTVVMNVGIVLLAYLITQAIFPDDTFLTLGVPIFILFNPQHTHLLSTVNNGNLAEFLATVALFFIVKTVLEGFSWLNALAILIFTVLAMWTKATAYFLPFTIGSIGLFYLWQYRHKWRWLLPIGLILGGLVYIALPARLVLLLSWAWNGFWTGAFYLDPIVPIDLFRSFWAYPGWTIFLLHPFWYWLLVLVTGLAVVGLIMLLIFRWRLLFQARYQARSQALIILAVSAVVAIGVLLAWNAISNSIVYRQARSIYPVMMPVSLFFMLGWRQLLPVRHRHTGLMAITIALFLFDSLVLFHYIIPFFYSRYSFN